MVADLKSLGSDKIADIRQYGMMIVLEFDEDLKGAELMDSLRAEG